MTANLKNTKNRLSVPHFGLLNKPPIGGLRTGKWQQVSQLIHRIGFTPEVFDMNLIELRSRSAKEKERRTRRSGKSVNRRKDKRAVSENAMRRFSRNTYSRTFERTDEEFCYPAPVSHSCGQTSKDSAQYREGI
jgi:hypothetical protein